MFAAIRLPAARRLAGDTLRAMITGSEIFITDLSLTLKFDFTISILRDVPLCYADECKVHCWGQSLTFSFAYPRSTVHSGQLTYPNIHNSRHRIAHYAGATNAHIRERRSSGIAADLNFAKSTRQFVRAARSRGSPATEPCSASSTERRPRRVTHKSKSISSDMRQARRRGFCPSCGARRMAESAAPLVDEVIPRVPVRQWVLSFPIPLRILFAEGGRRRGARIRAGFRIRGRSGQACAGRRGPHEQAQRQIGTGVIRLCLAALAYRGGRRRRDRHEVLVPNSPTPEDARSSAKCRRCGRIARHGHLL